MLIDCCCKANVAQCVAQLDHSNLFAELPNCGSPTCSGFFRWRIARFSVCSHLQLAFAAVVCSSILGSRCVGVGVRVGSVHYKERCYWQHALATYYGLYLLLYV